MTHRSFVCSLYRSAQILAIAALLIHAPPTFAAQLTATWNGNGDGVSYNDAANWDVGVVPINGADTYVVVIPASTAVTFDVPGTGHEVFQLTLGNGATLTMNAGRDLNVLDQASVGGRVTTDNGTFTAGAAATMFTGTRPTLSASGGGQISLGASSLSGSYSGSQTILLSTGINSELDLASLTSLVANDVTSGTDSLTVRASNDGTIDLSAVTSASSNDLIVFHWQTGGSIDLAALLSTAGVRFDVDIPSVTLSSLQSADRTIFDVAAGQTLTAPALTNVTNATFTLAPGATFTANNLTDVQSSTISLSPDRTLQTGTLTNINGSRFLLSDGAAFSNVSATSYTGSFVNSQVFLEADGSGSSLNLSTLQSIVANDVTSGTDSLTVRASNDGAIDLSAVTSASSNDLIDFHWQTGGSIDLAALLSTAGARFDVDIPNVMLPNLQTADRTVFDVAAGQTLTAPALTNVANATFTLAPGATFTANTLTDVQSSTISLSPDRTLQTGTLTNIDGSRLLLSDGAAFSNVSATSYTGSFVGSQVFLEADGNGSSLDLSTLQSMVANDTTTGTDTLTVRASNGGAIDLSSLASAASNNILALQAVSGGHIDLAGLRSANGVALRAESGGTIDAGRIKPGDDVDLSVTDLNSTIDFAGSVLLGPTSTATVSNGGELSLVESFRFEATSESNLQLDAAIVRLKGTGGQLLEVGGEDLGVDGATSGNFGIGQLVIGQTAQRTSVDLIEVIDNGNRGGGTEALYLFGLGGPDGLRILNDSALILNGINVYAWDAVAGQQVHLNSLFGPGDLRLPFDDGFLQVAPLDFQWDNPMGGDFNLSSNWSDGLVPLGSDAALWNLGSVAGYTVQFGSNVATDSAIIKNDNVTFDLGGFTYSTAGLHATDALVVGQSAFDQATLTVANGTLAATSGVIAAASGGTGSLNVGETGALEIENGLELGAGAATLTVETGGRATMGNQLDLGPDGTVDLLDGTVTVGTGPLETAAATLRVHVDGELAGNGSVSGHLIHHGTISTDIQGLTPGDEHDRLSFSGDASLGGNLQLNLNGFDPDLGAVISVLTANSVSGTFDTVSGLSIAPTKSLAVLYDATSVQVRVAKPGDANLDGSVTASADGGILLANLGQGAGKIWTDADFTGDGQVTASADGAVLLANLGTDTAAVPEPGTWFVVLMFLALGSGTLLRRSKG